MEFKYTEPNLGSIDQAVRLSNVKLAPVNDKGVILSCNDWNTSASEINTWESSVDIAIGMHFNDWDAEKKLGYMESTLVDNAKIAWTTFKNTTRYATFKAKFLEANGRGSFFGDFLKLEICGITNQNFAESERRKKAWIMLQTLQICDIGRFEEYIAAYQRLYYLSGTLENEELLSLFFTKLLEPWGEAMTRDYDEISPLDTLGRRIAYVREKLSDQCIDWRMKEEARGHYANRCPKKTTAKVVKFIEEEFNLIVFSDYKSDSEYSLYEIDSDYQYFTDKDSDYDTESTIKAQIKLLKLKIKLVEKKQTKEGTRIVHVQEPSNVNSTPIVEEEEEDEDNESISSEESEDSYIYMDEHYQYLSSLSSSSDSESEDEEVENITTKESEVPEEVQIIRTVQGINPENLIVSAHAYRDEVYNIEQTKYGVQEKLLAIELILKQTYSDNPLTLYKEEHPKCKLEILPQENLKELNITVPIYKKLIPASLIDLQEFQAQLKELQDLKLIRKSKSSWSSPTFMLQTFLGIVNYAASHYIPEMAKAKAPLQKLLRKNKKWEWNSLHTQIVREIKELYKKLPVLELPKDHDKISVTTDASKGKVTLVQTVASEEPSNPLMVSILPKDTTEPLSSKIKVLYEGLQRPMSIIDAWVLKGKQGRPSLSKTVKPKQSNCYGPSDAEAFANKGDINVESDEPVVIMTGVVSHQIF
ncbi:hypothetical protein ACLOJK_018540 [Asimina triloba]